MGTLPQLRLSRNDLRADDDASGADAFVEWMTERVINRLLASGLLEPRGERAVPNYLTVDEAARALKMHPRTVRRFIARKKLKAKRLGHGGSARVLICAESVRTLLEGEA